MVQTIGNGTAIDQLPNGKAAVEMGTLEGNAAGIKTEDKIENGKTKGELPVDGIKEEPQQQASEKDDLIQKEDILIAESERIGSTRALIAQAFKPPCPEPERPMSHWDHVLAEMKWLAIDVAQERLWKQTISLAISTEIAEMEGEFNLKQPPEEFRKYSDEIATLKLEAAKAAIHPTGRRSSKSINLPTNASLLGLGSEIDPAIKEMKEGAAELEITLPESISQIPVTYTWRHASQEMLAEHLEKLETKRLIVEETKYRAYRLEYEAAITSHQMAIAEQQAAAAAIDDFEFRQSHDLDLIDDGLLGPPRRSLKGRKRVYVDEYEDGRIDGYMDRRFKSYKDDMDPNYSVEARYQQRRAFQHHNKRVDNRNKHTSSRPEYQPGRMQGQAGSLVWSRIEDELLLAVVHEFGINWTLVSEVFSKSLALHGIYRPPSQCRQRFRQITLHDVEGTYTEEKASARLSLKIGKHQARELLIKSLPARDDKLVRYLEVLAQVGASARNRRLAEEKRSEQIRIQRQEPHSSYATVLNGIMQQTGGRHLSPTDLAGHLISTYSQARQVPQQGHPVGNVGTFGQGHGKGSSLTVDQSAQNRQVVAMGEGLTQSSMGIPTGQQVGNVNQAGQAGNNLVSAGRPPGPGSQYSVSLQQLTNILNTNKLPNGAELTEETRKTLEERKRSHLMRIQQQALAQRQVMSGQQVQGQGRPQMAAAMTPGIQLYNSSNNGAMSQVGIQTGNGMSGAQVLTAASQGGGVMVGSGSQQQLAQQMMQRQQPQQTAAPVESQGQGKNTE
eukprot:jgi/Picsp_1/2145/NSC_05610-R1_helicase sant- dna binding protein